MTSTIHSTSEKEHGGHGSADVQPPLLEVNALSTTFSVRGKRIGQRVPVRAVRDVSFKIDRGQTYGLVGESGCGKTTTGRTIIGLDKRSGGNAKLSGVDLTQGRTKVNRAAHRKVQMIFQDPYSSLNPKKRVGAILVEALKIQKIGATANERRKLAIEILERVGFGAEHFYRFPHEFSGGQRQRIGIARALIVSPELVICDESVSALDVSIQAQVLKLLRELQEELHLAYLFISHDLGVVRYIAHRVGVMYLGEIVEEADTEELFSNPKHPYTQALLSAVPIANPRVKRERIALTGEVPSPLNPPSGCPFSTRCPIAVAKCSEIAPELRVNAVGHAVACHLAD